MPTTARATRRSRPRAPGSRRTPTARRAPSCARSSRPPNPATRPRRRTSPIGSRTRLAFGTAGLRGELGAGSNRMNRVLVAQAAAGLAAYLLEKASVDAEAPGAAVAPAVVVGYDGRRNSQRVRAGLGRAVRRRGTARDPAAAAAADAGARIRRAASRRGGGRDGDGEPQSAERQRLQGLPRRRRAGRRRSSRPPTPRSRPTSSASPTTATSPRCRARSATRSRPNRSSTRTSTRPPPSRRHPMGADGSPLGVHRHARRRLGDALAHPRRSRATPRPSR